MSSFTIALMTAASPFNLPGERFLPLFFSFSFVASVVLLLRTFSSGMCKFQLLYFGKDLLVCL